LTLRTRLTEKLGIRHPILLAPMGSIAGGRLAGAVSEAGGLGLIGGGYGEKDWLEREFAAAGNRRVGCGFITWSLAKHPNLLDVVLAHRPAALRLSSGRRLLYSSVRYKVAIIRSRRSMLAPRLSSPRAPRQAVTVERAPRCL
jgi:NAD(P)H-dependent flavin oxidoreductase YrpB (nitropropane dioxygenase family)